MSTKLFFSSWAVRLGCFKIRHNLQENTSIEFVSEEHHDLENCSSSAGRPKCFWSSRRWTIYLFCITKEFSSAAVKSHLRIRTKHPSHGIPSRPVPEPPYPYRWHHSASRWVPQGSSGQMVLTDCPSQDCVFPVHDRIKSQSAAAFSSWFAEMYGNLNEPLRPPEAD